MPAFDWIVPSHVILLLVSGIIAAIAVIKAAVAVTIKVAVEVTIVYTIPREVILMTDFAEATPDGDLTHGTLHTTDHLSDTTTGHNLHLNLAEGIDHIHTVKAGPGHPREGMATILEVIMVQSLQITNAPDMLPELQ